MEIANLAMKPRCLLHVQCWRPPECDVVARDDDGIQAVRNALTYEVYPK